MFLLLLLLPLVSAAATVITSDMSAHDMDFQLEDDVLPPPYDNIQFDDSETQDVGGLFVPQPTLGVDSEANGRCRKKGRGKTIVKWGVSGMRERVKWGKYGVPLWPREKCAHYSNYLGNLAIDCGYFPIDVKDWRHFNEGELAPAWTLIEGTIDWSEDGTAAKKIKIKSTAFKKISDRWKHHKTNLKKLYWQPKRGTDERFQCPYSSIDADQWTAFVTYLDEEDTQIKADINVSNRSQSVMHHTTGTRTFAAVVYEWNHVEEEPDRLEIFKLIHLKKGKKNEYIDAASTKAVLDMEKAVEERITLNIDITPAVKEDIYAEVFGPEKRNQVRGLGAGVQWRDAPNIHIERRSVSCIVEGLKTKLEEQRLETERLRSEVEKERRAAAERENEASEMQKSLTTQMDEFKKEQETLMASKVKELALYEMGRWMREAGFSQIQTAPQIEPMIQLPQCIPTPEISDGYRPELP